MNTLNTFLLVVFPYVAGIVFLVGVIYRYRQTVSPYRRFPRSFSKETSFSGALFPFILACWPCFSATCWRSSSPQATLAWNSVPVRLIILEVSAFIFGLSLLFGLLSLLWRRLTNPRVRVVTSRMDIVIELLLLAQVVLGCWVALGFRWGSSWFAADLTPYLWSLLALSPETDAVFALPWVIRLHIVGAFLILFMVPFTRLVHFVVVPLHYIVRPYQVVMWNWDRKAVRDPEEPWSKARPKNN